MRSTLLLHSVVLGLALTAPQHLTAAEGLPIGELKRDTKIDFANEIVPFLRKNCFACHNEQKAKGDLNLESPEEMLIGGDSGPALVPGKPMESLLFLTAAHLEEEFMPPKNNKSNASNLNPAELALLRLWIEQGGEGKSSSILAGPIEWEPLEGVHSSYAVAISDNARFAATGNGNRLHVYDLRSGNLDAELVDPDGSPGTAHRDLVHTLAFNPQGTLASGGYRSVKLWERSLVAPATLGVPLQEAATVLTAHSGTAQAAAGDSKGHVALLDFAQPKNPIVLKLHDTAIRALQYSLDGKYLFTTSDDNTIIRVDLANTAQTSRVNLPSKGRSLTILAGGSKLAVGCEDGSIRLVSLTDFKANADAPPEATDQTQWKTPGQILSLSGIGDATGRILSAHTSGLLELRDSAGKVIRTFNHGGPISTVAVHKDTKQVASAGEDGVTKIWSIEDGKLQRELKGDLDFQQQRTRYSQNLELAKRIAELRKKQVEETTKVLEQLKTKAQTDSSKVAEIQKDLSAKEKTAAEKRKSDEDAKQRVAELEASGDSTLGEAQGAAKKAAEEATKAANDLVTAERNLRNAERTRDLTAKDTTRATQRLEAAEATSVKANESLALSEASFKEIEQKASQRKTPQIRTLAFSPDGTLLAVGTEEHGLRLWSTVTGQPLDVLHSSPVSSVIFGPEGHLLASHSDKGLLHWTRTSQWKLRRTLGDQEREDPFPDRVLSLAFHPNGQVLAAGSGIPSRDGSLTLWNIADGQMQGVIKAHQDTITGLAFSPGGGRIASSSTDRYIRIHQIDTQEMLTQLEGHTSHVLDVAWSADGETIASAGADHVAKLWTVATRKQKKTETGFKKELTTIAFVGTGENIVTGGGDKVLKAGGQNLPSIDDFIYDTAVSADGSIILAGGENGILRVWQASDRKLLYSFPSPGKTSPETVSK